jgi:hypothetical protein
MVRGDLEYGQRTIRRILKELEQPQSLEHKYAEAILAQAKRNAAGKPTPQARMAAENMVVERNTIGPLTGGIPAEEVAIGSEFGSHVYPQFQRAPNPRGYWLYPAAEDAKVLADTDQQLERLLDRMIAGGPI